MTRKKEFRYEDMKIVTYNVNGLRQRISQFGSLHKLLNSFDADIICIQETKLRRQELTAYLAIADGYESFFSCTRTSDKGRTGYSGVATFCRVKSAFSSVEAALPIAAEEGITGILGCSGKCDEDSVAEGLEQFSREELLKIDCEGRCIITDHGHFVLFNLYGPRAESDDVDRIKFKLNFFKILEKRWESLLHQGRRIFVVGDLNIAPFAIDRCDAGPDFDKNEFRTWFRSMLVESGGNFFDAFRAKHPNRSDAFTCWPSNTGAEQFNYGTRIDHILCAGSCLHEDHDLGHNLVNCHVKDCDIVTEYKRWKPGNAPMWKGGWNSKLQGSDHAPVYTSLVEIPDVSQHSTPSLAARYLPMIHGLQQTLVAALMRRLDAKQAESLVELSSFSDKNISLGGSSHSVKRSINNCHVAGTNSSCCSTGKESENTILKVDEHSEDLTKEDACNTKIAFNREYVSTMPNKDSKKRARKSQQLSLRSFFQKSPILDNGMDSSIYISNSQTDVLGSRNQSLEASVVDDDELKQNDSSGASSQSQEAQDASFCPGKDKNIVALLEWQRIQSLMQNSIPLCKGHREPCVSRVVKKPGPTFGHRFYVCARAEGPASNPEANCGYFRWASAKSRSK